MFGSRMLCMLECILLWDRTVPVCWLWQQQDIYLTHYWMLGTLLSPFCAAFNPYSSAVRWTVVIPNRQYYCYSQGIEKEIDEELGNLSKVMWIGSREIACEPHSVWLCNCPLNICSCCLCRFYNLSEVIGVVHYGPWAASGLLSLFGWPVS